jgi:DNA-binding NarL/FixJ family response regulator
MDNIRVLLLDYHTMVREGLRCLIEGHPGLEVVGEAGVCEEAKSLIQQLSPDIILLELNLDGDLDIDLVPELLSVAEDGRIILVTGIHEAQIQHQAVQLGVMGVVTKEESSSVLLKAIEKVHAGEVWIDRMMMADVLTQMWRARSGEEEDPERVKISLLSDREREVVELIGMGLKNKQIADCLSISEVTVRHHLTSVYSKLGVSDRLELIIYAYRHELAELPP